MPKFGMEQACGCESREIKAEEKKESKQEFEVQVELQPEKRSNNAIVRVEWGSAESIAFCLARMKVHRCILL